MRTENEASADSRLFWVGLTIWGGIFGTGLYIAIESHVWRGSLVTIIGLIGMAYLIRDNLKGTPVKFVILVGTAVVTWGLLGYTIYDHHHFKPMVVAVTAVQPAPPTSIPSQIHSPVVGSMPHKQSSSGVTNFDESKLHQALIGPCKKISNLRAYMRDQNPNVTIYLNDPHDPDERNLADKIHDGMLAAGCTYVNSDGAGIDSLIQNYKPFYGIKVWNGYTEMTQKSAEELRESLNETHHGTTIYDAGTVPDGGHFEGIAILIGKLSR
jgi:hypothetical protein